MIFSRSQPRIGTYDLWLLDIARNVEQRLTSDRLSEYAAVWLRSGTGTIFSQRTPPRLFRKDLTTGVEQPLSPPPLFTTAEDITPDGKTLLYIQRTPRGTFDMWTMAIDDPRSAKPLLETPFDESSARFSPDGRYLAFASNELGRYAVIRDAVPDDRREDAACRPAAAECRDGTATAASCSTLPPTAS